MEIPDEYLKMGIMWSAHFQDACAAFGMENALITMMTYPDMFQAVIDRITDFYLEVNELFYEATRDHLDAILIGNDFGSQTALMVDPDLIRKFVCTTCIVCYIFLISITTELCTYRSLICCFWSFYRAWYSVRLQLQQIEVRACAVDYALFRGY